MSIFESDESDDLMNPFDDEFDISEVVNRGDHTKPAFPEFASNAEIQSGEPDERNEPLISNDDLSVLLNSPAAKKSNINLASLIDEDDNTSSVIKKEDIEKGLANIVSAHEFNKEEYIQNNADEIADLDLLNDTDLELNLDLDSKPDAELADVAVPEGISYEVKNRVKYEGFDDNDDFSPEKEIADHLQRQFKDFIIAPKISGHQSTLKSKNLISAEDVGVINKKVEIADSMTNEDQEAHQTSIVINRDSEGEIESIEVFCKCGERTLVKFDYVDEHSDEDLTEIISDRPAPVAFTDLNRPIEDINMVNPDLVLRRYELEEEFEPDEPEIEEDEDDEDEEEYQRILNR